MATKPRSPERTAKTRHLPAEDEHLTMKYRVEVKHTKDSEPKIGTDRWWRTVLYYDKSVFALYSVPPIERIELVKTGVPATAVNVIARAMGVARDTLYETLGVKRATVERKIREKARLSQDQGERVMGIARLIGQVDQLVHESGDSHDFDAARWVAEWLERPLPALGGRRPGSLMDTADGREIVSGLIAQMQSGAYA